MEIQTTIDTRQEPSVIFSMQKVDTGLPDRDYVLVYPSADKFNNFGYRTYCHYIAKTGSGIELVGMLHLAFMGEEPRPYKVITAALESKKTTIVDSSELPHFFSMLTAMQGYRDVVSKLEPKPAQEFLLVLNDLVVINYNRKVPVFIEGATSTEVFKLSFLRNSESFFAYHNAESVLDGLQFESLGQVPHKLDLKFKLDGFTNAHELSFNFDPKALLPKRICVVIGKNGVGKSQALGHLARAALAGDESFSDGSGNRPSVNRLVAIGTPGEARVTFPAERRGTGKIYYRRLLLSRNNGKDGWRGLGELLVQLARSEESVKENDRWRIFCDSLSTIIPLNELAVPLREGADLSRWGEQFCCGTTTYMGLEKFRRTGEQARLETWGAVQPKSDPVRFINGKVYGLSSGQLAFLRFAAQVCLYIDNSTLVLLDEPETHLHPNLISDFVDLLDKLLEATGSIAIIATHSVYFVREVPRSQTQILKEGAERSIEVQTPRLRTFGADVGSISHFVFADNMTNKLLEKVKEKITESNCNIENFLEEVEGELSMEAVMSLRRKLAKEGTA